MFRSIDTCQNKVFADQYHFAHIAGSPRSAFFFKLTADQVLVFDWIAGSIQVNSPKHTELNSAAQVTDPRQETQAQLRSWARSFKETICSPENDSR